MSACNRRRWLTQTAAYAARAAGVTGGSFALAPRALARPMPAGHAAGVASAIEADVATEQARLQVPGLVMVVAWRGQIVLQLARGWADVERARPMTLDTVHPMASVSKLLSALALSAQQLGASGTAPADANRVWGDWDTRAVDLDPRFKLATPQHTERTTLRHLLSHRCGLPRHDWVWMDRELGLFDVPGLLQHLEPAHAPGQRFQYGNLAFAAGFALLGNTRSGTPAWEAMLARQLLEPLGLAHTGARFAKLQPTSGGPSVAQGYERLDGRRQPTDYQDTDPVAPAAGLHTTGRDMGRLLQALTLPLGESISNSASSSAASTATGTEPSNPLRTALQALLPTQVIVRQRSSYLETGAVHYGLGCYRSHYRSLRMAYHPGDLPGVSTLLTVVPEDDLAIYTAVNLTDCRIGEILTYRWLDRWHDLNLLDWPGRFELMDQARLAMERAQSEQTQPRNLETIAAQRAALQTGRYHHPAYGDLDITRAAATGHARADSSAHPAARWQVNFRGQSAPLEPVSTRLWQAGPEGGGTNRDTPPPQAAWATRVPAGHRLHGLQFAFAEARSGGGKPALWTPLEPTTAPLRFERTEAASAG